MLNASAWTCKLMLPVAGLRCTGPVHLCGTHVPHSPACCCAGLVLHKALRTIEDSRSPSNRLANLPPAKRMDYYYSKLLGKDWREQMEEDMAQAMKDVDEGLITGEHSAKQRYLHMHGCHAGDIRPSPCLLLTRHPP